MYDYELSIANGRFHRERLLADAEMYRLIKAARAARSERSRARPATVRPPGARRATTAQA